MQQVGGHPALSAQSCAGKKNQPDSSHGACCDWAQDCVTARSGTILRGLVHHWERSGTIFSVLAGVSLAEGLLTYFGAVRTVPFGSSKSLCVPAGADT